MFFRYLKLYYKVVPKNTEFEEIDIKDIDKEFLKRITLNDAYEFMSFLFNDRGLNASSRSRKARKFFLTRSSSTGVSLKIWIQKGSFLFFS